MAQGTTKMRVILIDEDGTEVGTADVPIVMESPELLGALEKLDQVLEALLLHMKLHE